MSEMMKSAGTWQKRMAPLRREGISMMMMMITLWLPRMVGIAFIENDFSILAKTGGINFSTAK